MMRYVAVFFLSVLFSQVALAQGKINYTINNGLQIAGVDGTNPVIYDNDWVVDTPELFYLWLKANRGQLKLVGNISTRNLFMPPNVTMSHDETWNEWTRCYNAANAIGLRNIPAPIKGSDWYLSKPGSGVIEQTVRKDNAGSDLIISEALKASPSKPLVIIVGGQVTTVANAYLKNNSIADRIVVFHVDGWGVTQYNGVDFWATEIVMRRMKYINWDGNLNSWYGPYTPINVPNTGLPNNQFANLYLNHYINDTYRLFKDIGDAPPAAYLFNHALWRNVVRKNAANQTITGDNYDFLLVSDNDFQGMGAEIGNFIRDPNNYIPANQPSNQAPSVSITGPANNSNFSVGSSITISANASDPDGSVQRVEFFNGSTKIGEDLSSPYSFVWSSVSAGTYTITAKATDNAGATTTSGAITIRVNSNAAPTVTMTGPANNSTFTFGTNITVTANASDSDGSIARVEFYNGTLKIGEDTSSPYSVTYGSAAIGDHGLYAKAFDNLGAVTTSGEVIISIRAATNNAPTVSLTSPGHNTTFASGATVTITANAADNDGSVSKVEFFNGTTKLGEDTTPPYSFNWTSVNPGSYSISAKVTDNAGATANSTSVSFTVQPANVSPTVSITAPANNASYNTGANITITANSSDSDGTVAKVEFFNGATKLGEDISSPYSFAWNSVPAGTFAITAKATDNQGATTTSSAVNITVTTPNAPPNAAPGTSITAPANNASFSNASDITITASASDSDGTVAKVEFFNGATKLGEDTSSPYSFVWNSVAAGSYALTAKATDNLGASTTSSTVNITVRPPNAPPVVSITAPANNATFNPGTNVTITASASDPDGTVAKVEFFNGATKLGEDTSSPYSFVWNSVVTGGYSISAKATDNLGATVTSATISITVGAANTPPVVNLTAPANNASFNTNSNITLTATATDANGSVAKVEFFNGAAKLGEDLTSPYSFVWNNVTNGNYVLIAKATDNENAVSSSSAINIVVTANPVAPVVNITGPSEGSSVMAGTPVTISATASTPTGSILKTEFYNGTTKLGEDASVPYSFNWNNAAEGTYTISVKATSNQGLAGTDEVKITVARAAVAPPSNDAPVANAGDDVTQNLTNETLTINGTGTDEDGQITTYAWTQVSGPTEATLTQDNSGDLHLDDLTAGVFIFELTVTDNQNATGKDQVIVTILDEIPFSANIPRYFTPNNDGINDVWEWPDIELYENSTLVIFNRFGQKIYETNAYQNNWNGTVDGKPLQEDAYYYNIRFSNTDIKGAVRIVR